jgi:hypothetical protein
MPLQLPFFVPVQERISPCRQFSVFRGPERNYAIGACAVKADITPFSPLITSPGDALPFFRE